MRTLILSLATATLALAAPATAVPLSCNPAVQNWQNGSKDTCPYATGNAAAPLFVPEYRAPVEIEYEPELEESVD
jgi:hypothetical protein